MFFLNKSKFITTSGVLAFFLFSVLVLLFGVTTQVESYTLISPIPGVGESVSLSESGGAANYLNNIFTLFISIIAVLGVIKLMLCGFQYMTSEAISSKEEAKKCMTGVFGGLFIVLLSVLVLQTINPEILQLKFFATLEQRVGDLDLPTTGSGGGGGGSGGGVALRWYDNRIIIDQGFCFVGDDTIAFPADVECFGVPEAPEAPWTEAQCLVAQEAYDAVFGYGIDEPCFSTSDGSRGTGTFCYDLTTSAVGGPDVTTTQQQCYALNEDSLNCEKQRGLASTRPLFVSSTLCYRPGND